MPKVSLPSSVMSVLCINSIFFPLSRPFSITIQMKSFANISFFIYIYLSCLYCNVFTGDRKTELSATSVPQSRSCPCVLSVVSVLIELSLDPTYVITFIANIALSETFCNLSERSSLIPTYLLTLLALTVWIAVDEKILIKDHIAYQQDTVINVWIQWEQDACRVF